MFGGGWGGGGGQGKSKCYDDLILRGQAILGGGKKLCPPEITLQHNITSAEYF